ncbi:MAG: polysaccharide biosynthesis protein [Microvirga sp.]|nr:polysaccharide biosynthesis protein [Microvirga sp.]
MIANEAPALRNDGAALEHAQRSAATVFAIRIAGAALAYGTQVLLARLMGRAGYGVFAIAWVWTLILGHVSLLGLSQSVCRWIPAYRARGEIERARGFLFWGAAVSLVSAMAISLVGALALWFAQDFLAQTYLAIVPPFIFRQGLIGIHATLRELTRRTAILTSLATAGLGGGLLLVAPMLLDLFGPGFNASFPVLAILVIGTALQTLLGPAEDLLNMLGAARDCAIISLCALIAAIVLGVILMPTFGMLGGATAMMLASVGRALALAIAVRIRFGVKTHVFA